MRYYQHTDEDGKERLIVEDDETAFDLTSAEPELTSFRRCLRAAEDAGSDVDAIAATAIETATEVGFVEVEALSRPTVPDEVWAAGVTYEISEAARESESSMPDMYMDVYEADRPEIFFKATPNRIVGSGDAVGVRADSNWDVPEPELGVVLHHGAIVGYTIGNDVSSREIEGENPLYLPQAKVYDRCCAIGPCIASPGTVDDPHDLEMTMAIQRGDETVFEGATTTAELTRTCEDLVSYYTRHNAVPELSVLLTGTSIVPDDDFTLQEDDEVIIEIDLIGILHNSVETV